jgi:hypothetical protein
MLFNKLNQQVFLDLVLNCPTFFHSGSQSLFEQVLGIYLFLGVNDCIQKPRNEKAGHRRGVKALSKHLIGVLGSSQQSENNHPAPK